jgi:hypothetical protein
MLKYVHNIYKIMVKILDMMDKSSSHLQFFKLTWVTYLTFNPLSGIMNYFENFEWSSELQNNQIQLYIIPVILVDNYCMHCD